MLREIGGCLSPHPPMAGIRQLMRRFPVPAALLTACAIAVLSWSSAEPGVAHAQTLTACVTGGAVSKAVEKPELVSDCEALLVARDILAGTATLNWSADVPIVDWDGVYVHEGGEFVRGLDLARKQLTGAVSTQLGGLSRLQWLDLSENQLTGPIPPELGGLGSLQRLDLSENQLTGPIPPELGGLGSLQWLDLSENQLTGPIPPELNNIPHLIELRLGGTSVCLPEAARQLLRHLQETDIHILPSCEEDALVFTVDGGPQVYNDNVFILPVEEDLIADELLLWNYTNRFFKYFDDEFDFLIFFTNLHRSENPHNFSGAYHRVMNDVEGIGVPIFNYGYGYGSAGALQGAIYLSSYDVFPGLLLHELMHRWANHIVPTNASSHWGFSSAYGQLGGFDIAELVDHGGGRYSAGFFDLGGAPTPYSVIELYLAGLIPPEEVPDLWVAEDGKWLVTEDGNWVKADDGDRMFTATKFRTYTIEGIISEYGRRVPDVSQAQRDFRAAAILLIDEDHPVSGWLLDQMSRSAASYSGADTDEGSGRFWEATGGRATLTMDGLSQFRKPVTAPGSPTGLIVTRNSPTQTNLGWSEPSSYGGSAITAYDLRHVETSADETVDSNWTVVQDVWTAGSGALRYTVAGFSDGSQYDFQVRAVNAAGDGPWSDTATGPPSTQRVCVTGGAVANAASNPWLVSDCEALLAARDTLAGSATLNWSADTPITEWHGVTVEGTPERVTNLSLTSQGLTGAIPSELGDLVNLQGLNLRDNQLAGAVPSELGDLVNLQVLNLRDNQLAGAVPSELGDLVNLRTLLLAGNQLIGEIPSELGGLANLQWLVLGGNQLSGAIPSELGDFANLRLLVLSRNQLSGAIPSELGDLANLEVLSLRGNQLTGAIPASLGRLANLEQLRIHDNQLTGCIPLELRDVAYNDLDRLGLPFCDATNSSPEFPAKALLPAPP